MDHGLHVILEQQSKKGKFVDIVAIHGLNGHYERTWTDKETGVNWLTDIVPHIAQSARVLSFSYNSMLGFNATSNTDISTFGDQLLENLMAARSRIADKNRPIIFVCHSFGGIIFKQVRIRSASNPNPLGPYLEVGCWVG
jgi:protein SERAC1